MGIYDREYYRRDSGWFGALQQSRAVYWLIGINVACFIFQLATRAGNARGLGPFTDALILNVPKVFEGQVWRLVTYAFLHDPDSILHIVFNMYVLFAFGRHVEELLGSVEFLALYLCATVVGSLGVVLAFVLGFSGPLVLGASGAVMSVLLVFACYYPRQVVLLFFIIPVPIWLLVVLIVGLDSFGLLSQNNQGVATSAHLAGAAFGFAYFKLKWRLTGWMSSLGNWREWSRRRARPDLRLYREDDDFSEAPTPRSSPFRSPEEERLEAQVDAILEKIQRVGMSGLTESERQTLLRASEAIKRRRG